MTHHNYINASTWLQELPLHCRPFEKALTGMEPVPNYDADFHN
jgi:hypothetical protein